MMSILFFSCTALALFVAPCNGGGIVVERKFISANEAAAKQRAASEAESFGKSLSIGREMISSGGGAALNSPGPAATKVQTTVSKVSFNGKECIKDCVEEGALGPLNAPKIVEIVRDPSGVYASLATFHSYSKFAELLTGSPLKSKDDVNQLCLRAFFTPEINSILGYSNGTIFNSDCKKSKIGLSANCKIGSDNTNVNPKNYPSGYSSVFTDEEDSVLVVICFNDGDKVWFVLTLKDKSLTSERKDEFLAKVGELGLRTSDVVQPNFQQNCPDASKS